MLGGLGVCSIVRPVSGFWLRFAMFSRGVFLALQVPWGVGDDWPFAMADFSFPCHVRPIFAGCSASPWIVRWFFLIPQPPSLLLFPTSKESSSALWPCTVLCFLFVCRLPPGRDGDWGFSTDATKTAFPPKKTVSLSCRFFFFISI